MKNHFKLIVYVLVLGLLFVPVATQLGQVSAEAAGFPSVTRISGNQWYYTCPSTWNNYFQVPYANRNDSGAAPVTLTGTNLDAVSSVGISASGYTVTIKSRTSTQLVLDIRAGQPRETPRPAKAPMLYLVHRNGVLMYTIQPGIMPTLYVNNLSWAQCTWFAGIRRIETSRSMVNAYAQGSTLSPNPNSVGFPRTGAVLMTNQRHMSFVESMRETGRTNYSDGSARISYQINISQYNCPCGREKTYASISMVILRSRSGAYTFGTKPVVCSMTVDRVRQ